jgi:hypothetical protein
MQINEPFILRTRLALPQEPSPSSEHCYDYVRQIWINATTGMPVITENDTQQASKFGETSITETREGADQSEISTLDASRFGETSMTKTSEGHDQGESILASKFGETSITAAAEGLDKPVGASRTTDASDRHF